MLVGMQVRSCRVDTHTSQRVPPRSPPTTYAMRLQTRWRAGKTTPSGLHKGGSRASPVRRMCWVHRCISTDMTDMR
jgi:hypothetical protein